MYCNFRPTAGFIVEERGKTNSEFFELRFSEKLESKSKSKKIRQLDSLPIKYIR
jgi:hypothetical protein